MLEMGLHLKPEALARYGLPDSPYPLSMDLLEKTVGSGGELPLAALLSVFSSAVQKEA